MQEKSKANKGQVFWAYNLSKRFHLLKQDQLEVTASLEQCLEHLKKLPPQDVHHFFKVGMIKDYKGYDVAIRSLNRIRRSQKSPDGSIEEAFSVI